jgi:hypothetical protein
MKYPQRISRRGLLVASGATPGLEPDSLRARWDIVLENG